MSLAESDTPTIGVEPTLKETDIPVTVRLRPRLVEIIDELTKRKGKLSRSDYIREAIYSRLHEEAPKEFEEVMRSE